MITLQLAQEYLNQKNTQIFSWHCNWIKNFTVTEISIRNDLIFGDEYVFVCKYWDVGLNYSRITEPISKFEYWLQDRRQNRLAQIIK